MDGYLLKILEQRYYLCRSMYFNPSFLTPRWSLYYNQFLVFSGVIKPGKAILPPKKIKIKRNSMIKDLCIFEIESCFTYQTK